MTTNNRKKTDAAPASDKPQKAPAIVPMVGRHAALRLEFAAWIIAPTRKETQKQWAKAHGVDESTLSDWKRHPEYLAAIADWRAGFKARFGEIAGALHRKAATGHVPAARTLAEILGELAPQKVEQVYTLASFLQGEAGPNAGPRATVPFLEGIKAAKAQKVN